MRRLSILLTVPSSVPPSSKNGGAGTPRSSISLARAATMSSCQMVAIWRFMMPIFSTETGLLPWRVARFRNSPARLQGRE
jgi:hypothetical protein